MERMKKNCRTCGWGNEYKTDYGGKKVICKYRIPKLPFFVENTKDNDNDWCNGWECKCWKSKERLTKV